MPNYVPNLITPIDSDSSSTLTNSLVSNSFKICIWNVHSICNKIRSVLAYLSDNDVDTAFISETWLPDANCYQTSIIKNESAFDIIHSIKPQQQGIGGVGLIYRNSLSKKF